MGGHQSIWKRPKILRRKLTWSRRFILESFCILIESLSNKDLVSSVGEWFRKFSKWNSSKSKRILERSKLHQYHSLKLNQSSYFKIFLRFWWQMLETNCFGDMLKSSTSSSVGKIFCHQHLSKYKVTNMMQAKITTNLRDRKIFVLSAGTSVAGK